MKVSAVLKQKRNDIVSLPPSATVSVATKLMSQQGLGAVLVQNQDGKLVGILSERDVIFAAADLGHRVFNLRIEDLMTREVKTCRSLDDVTTVLHTMNTYRIRHVPVVDGGQVVGIVSVRDVARNELMEKDQEVSGYLALLRLRTYAGGYLA